MHSYSFEKLLPWMQAKEVCKQVYILTKQFPAEERFGMVNQIRRSCSSICAILAEGSGRSTKKDQAHFSNLAYSTTIETINHMILAFELGMVSQKDYQDIRMQLESIAKLVSLLRNSQLAKP